MNEPEQTREHQEQALAGEIIADAQRRAERIGKRAERESHKIADDARKQADAERRRILSEARRRAEQEAQRVASRIEQELQGLRRRTLYRIVERVRDEARGELARIAAGGRHREVLEQLALLAVQAMDGDSFQLLLRPQDRESCGQALVAEIRRAVKEQLGRDIQVEIATDTLEATGGLVVRDAAGRQIADQTFEGRMSRLWDQIGGELPNHADWHELAPWMRDPGGKPE